MDINYQSKNTEIIAKLESEGYSADTIMHQRRCFEKLWKCLSLKDTPFSMDLALDWLESRQPSWTHGTYKKCRRALYWKNMVFSCQFWLKKLYLVC